MTPTHVFHNKKGLTIVNSTNLREIALANRIISICMDITVLTEDSDAVPDIDQSPEPQVEARNRLTSESAFDLLTHLPMLLSRSSIMRGISRKIPLVNHRPEPLDARAVDMKLNKSTS